ncbi:MAG: hypothetical protein JNL70_06560 [Saprospiraceae bacterium]|nr:hypothetical protein [Saprospiraceae bacterium]
MNIKEALEAEHSKTLTLKILDYIGHDLTRLDELMACFFSEQYRLCQRAAWAVGYISERNPTLIEPYLERMLLNLQNPTHDAIVRNTMRAFRELPEIPDDILGLTADACFRYVQTPSVAIAIRAFSMHVLEKVCRKVPELKEEIALICEDWLQNEEAPGIRATAKDVLKKLRQNK